MNQLQPKLESEVNESNKALCYPILKEALEMQQTPRYLPYTTASPVDSLQINSKNTSNINNIALGITPTRKTSNSSSFVLGQQPQQTTSGRDMSNPNDDNREYGRGKLFNEVENLKASLSDLHSLLEGIQQQSRHVANTLRSVRNTLSTPVRSSRGPSSSRTAATPVKTNFLAAPEDLTASAPAADVTVHPKGRSDLRISLGMDGLNQIESTLSIDEAVANQGSPLTNELHQASQDEELPTPTMGHSVVGFAHETSNAMEQNHDVPKNAANASETEEIKLTNGVPANLPKLLLRTVFEAQDSINDGNQIPSLTENNSIALINSQSLPIAASPRPPLPTPRSSILYIPPSPREYRRGFQSSPSVSEWDSGGEESDMEWEMANMVWPRDVLQATLEAATDVVAAASGPDREHAHRQSFELSFGRREGGGDGSVMSENSCSPASPEPASFNQTNGDMNGSAWESHAVPEDEVKQENHGPDNADASQMTHQNLPPLVHRYLYGDAAIQAEPSAPAPAVPPSPKPPMPRNQSGTAGLHAILASMLRAGPDGHMYGTSFMSGSVSEWDSDADDESCVSEGVARVYPRDVLLSMAAAAAAANGTANGTAEASAPPTSLPSSLGNHPPPPAYTAVAAILNGELPLANGIEHMPTAAAAVAAPAVEEAGVAAAAVEEAGAAAASLEEPGEAFRLEDYLLLGPSVSACFDEAELLARLAAHLSDEQANMNARAHPATGASQDEGVASAVGPPLSPLLTQIHFSDDPEFGIDQPHAASELSDPTPLQDLTTTPQAPAPELRGTSPRGMEMQMEVIAEENIVTGGALNAANDRPDPTGGSATLTVLEDLFRSEASPAIEKFDVGHFLTRTASIPVERKSPKGEDQDLDMVRDSTRGEQSRERLGELLEAAEKSRSALAAEVNSSKELRAELAAAASSTFVTVNPCEPGQEIALSATSRSHDPECDLATSIGNANNSDQPQASQLPAEDLGSESCGLEQSRSFSDRASGVTTLQDMERTSSGRSYPIGGTPKGQLGAPILGAKPSGQSQVRSRRLAGPLSVAIPGTFNTGSLFGGPPGATPMHTPSSASSSPRTRSFSIPAPGFNLEAHLMVLVTSVLFGDDDVFFDWSTAVGKSGSGRKVWGPDAGAAGPPLPRRGSSLSRQKSASALSDAASIGSVEDLRVDGMEAESLQA